MNLIQGIAFHIIAIINASFLLFYVKLINSNNRRIRETLIASKVIASLTIIMASSALIWEFFISTNMDEGISGVNSMYYAIEVILVLVVYGLSFTLFYSKEFGIDSNKNGKKLSNNERNNAYGTMAVSYVFLTYMIIWGIFMLLILVDE